MGEPRADLRRDTSRGESWKQIQKSRSIDWRTQRASVAQRAGRQVVAIMIRNGWQGHTVQDGEAWPAVCNFSKSRRWSTVHGLLNVGRRRGRRPVGGSKS